MAFLPRGWRRARLPRAVPLRATPSARWALALDSVFVVGTWHLRLSRLPQMAAQWGCAHVLVTEGWISSLRGGSLQAPCPGQGPLAGGTCQRSGPAGQTAPQKDADAWKERRAVLSGSTSCCAEAARARGQPPRSTARVWRPAASPLTSLGCPPPRAACVERGGAWLLPDELLALTPASRWSLKYTHQDFLCDHIRANSNTQQLMHSPLPET